MFAAVRPLFVAALARFDAVAVVLWRFSGTPVLAAAGPLGSTTAALRGRPRGLVAKPSDVEAVAGPAAALTPSGMSPAIADEATGVLYARPSVTFSPTSCLTSLSEF